MFLSDLWGEGECFGLSGALVLCRGDGPGRGLDPQEQAVW